MTDRTLASAAVAGAVLALYLDRAARLRHREYMRALRQYRTSVTVRDVTMHPRPDTSGPFIRVAGPDDDALHHATEENRSD